MALLPSEVAGVAGEVLVGLPVTALPTACGNKRSGR